ncbi:uncharacterized protein [Diabrotica undecimpunctata]|uniref:uncharacterized protein n=1 Tax=Diabrotica undecimpunctata TaxID=50387 RepID=UPI003B642838
MKISYTVIVIFNFALLVFGVSIEETNDGNAQHKSWTKLQNCGTEILLQLVDTANDIKKVDIIPGISLVSTVGNARTAKDLVYPYNSSDLPTDPIERKKELTDLLIKSIQRLFSTKILQLRLPNYTTANISQSLDEARGKTKRMSNPWMLGVGVMALTLTPLLLGGLTLLSVKALVISKIALFIILVVQFFLSGSQIPSPTYFGYGHGFSTLPYPYIPTTNQGGVNSLGGWNSNGGWSQDKSYNLR